MKVVLDLVKRKPWSFETFFNWKLISPSYFSWSWHVIWIMISRVYFAHHWKVIIVNIHPDVVFRIVFHRTFVICQQLEEKKISKINWNFFSSPTMHVFFSFWCSDMKKKSIDCYRKAFFINIEFDWKSLLNCHPLRIVLCANFFSIFIFIFHMYERFQGLTWKQLRNNKKKNSRYNWILLMSQFSW